ncbi:LacI family transcriptional regulator [Phytoactinopolyspora alkaliphila]|uniref:LacI family transcriptional regulator n=1 Tax=Phytoactinopolyspora alkaliphila TaxID=1783498 RepID=A0A6N9YFK6_9ACTN|nr:LacI family transcriptional regulator [Phytoactinopolyspora alkaliphila]
MAKAAGVSPALISLALNDRIGVAPETRARILEIADELGYQAHPHAKALRTGESNTLALVIRNLQNPFFVDVVSSAQAAASARGFTMLMVDSDYSRKREREHIERLAAQRVSGLAIAPVGGGSAIERWLELCPGKPTVVLNASTPSLSGVSRVSPDNESAVRLAVQHLAALGHQRIAFLTAPSDVVADDDRLRAFSAVVDQHALTPFPVETPLTLDGVYHTMLGLLSASTPPTAVITNSDFTAHAVYLAARTAGCRVGEDISVIGHDDLPTSALLNPPLTTIRLDRRAVGHALFARLLSNRTLADHREPVELVVRGSTGPVPTTS